jgi:transposase
MGRKSKYTSEVVDKLTDAIRTGATYDLACKYAGIAYETFRQWQAEKPAFSEVIKAAEGEAAVGWLQKIERATVESWQAAAWKLERRYPQDYGKTVQEQSGTLEVIVRRDGGDKKS